MGLKLNATNGGGSVELDVPDTVNSDLALTVPATAGDIVVKGTDDSVDLGDVNIDSSGRLLVGTSSVSSDITIAAQGNSLASTGPAYLQLRRGALPSDTQSLGWIQFADNSGNVGAQIYGEADQNWTSGSAHGSALVFSTTADGASSPTERMRITEDGDIRFAMGSFADSSVHSNSGNGGVIIDRTGGFMLSVARNSGTPLALNRMVSDGGLISFYQAGSFEGNIAVSGSTISYNGAHLSRWSQLPGGGERTEILRGSVLSNIDEMCEWVDAPKEAVIDDEGNEVEPATAGGPQANEQLNRMKVSDVEGDKNVAGVFQGWDDDDDTYINDFYCAMTGDFIIRIAEGVAVQRGDLLMSAGDGTAKPQDDDIIRSKTIAKVTSTHVTCTYEDGSYCVPCVLMAC